MRHIRILIADDHAVLRAGLRLLIEQQPDLKVIGEVADGARVVPEVHGLRPDLVLLDLGMANRSGIPTIAEIRKSFPAMRVLVLTMHADAAYLRMALSAGAHGYLVKSSAHNELLEAIRALNRGGRFIDRAFSPECVRAASFPEPREGDLVGIDLLGLLSPREREVFDLLATGFTNKQVGERLQISVKSAETHRARVMEKLALRTRADLIRFALACGVLTPPSHTDVPRA